MALQSVTSLSTLVLQAAASSVTFSNIPGTYRDLILTVDSLSNSPSNMILYFNGDTTSGNYVNFYSLGNGSSLVSGVDSNGAYAGGIYGTDKSFNIIQIFDYSQTNKHKNRLTKLNVPGNQTTFVTGRWANTAAVTSLTLSVGTNTFSAGATFELWGRIA
jgi:hypothetical protein